MKKDIIIKDITKIEKESAHDGSGARKLLLSQDDNISSNIEAKGNIENIFYFTRIFN